MQLVLRGGPGKIRAAFTGGDGEALDPTSPTVTITRDSDGEEIETGTAAPDGEFSLNPADIPDVDLLRVMWEADNSAASDQEVGVVGGFLCPLEEISAAITAAGRPEPEAPTLRALREAAESVIEDACGVAFRPRYRRDVLDGRGSGQLLLSAPRPIRILSATVDGIDVASGVSLSVLGAERSSGWSTGLAIDIAYVHGWPVPPPQIRRAAARLARFLHESGDQRVGRFSEQGESFTATVAGIDGALTSLPEVNAAIEAYRYRSVG